MPAEPHDLVIGLVGEPPAILAEHPSAIVLAAAVTEALAVRDARGELAPRLAAELPTFENGGLRLVYDGDEAGHLVATVRIRPDARWHDGRPITAEDVRFAHEEGRAVPTSAGSSALASRIDRVVAVGDGVVRLVGRSGERWPDLVLAARVLPRHVLANAGPEALASYARSPVHAGPYTVSSWIAGRGLTLSAFARYAGGAPGIPRIEVRFFEQRAALLEALSNGEVDVAPAPGLDADLARVLDRIADGTERTRLATIYTPIEAVETLRFGARFADERTRRAIALAIDRHAIVESVFHGLPRVTRSYLVPPLAEAVDLGPAPRGDVASARAYLAEAGYRRGNFGILERDGERLIIAIVVPEGSIPRVEVARLVAGQLAAVGIAAEVREAPAAALASVAGTFDLAIVPEPAHDAALATERYVGRVDAWFDVLAAAARAARDQGERRAIYGELQRLWAASLPAVPLYQYLRVDVAPRSLTGARPSAAGSSLLWNVGEWRYRP